MTDNHRPVVRNNCHKDWVLWILLALLYACNHPLKDPERAAADVIASLPELSALDSLMWRQPDTALMRLLPWFDTCCRDAARHVSTTTAYNRHYANLLLSELLYKNDSVQTNRPALLQAMAYFDSLVRQAPPLKGGRGGLKKPQSSSPNPNLYFLDARAHYINGVGYYEQNHLEDACAEYLKALEVMENHFEEKELAGHRARFMTYTYNRLGELFSEQYMMEPAIACFQQSHEFCKIAPNSPYSISNALYRIGLQYNKMHKKDSANYYYERAIELMPDNNNLCYRDLESSRALLSYQLGQSAEASLNTLFRMVQLADDEEERLTRFLTIGDIYFEEAMYDSALRYLEPVFQNTNDRVMRQIQAADIIRVIYDSVGMEENADEYVRFSAVNKKSNGENNAEVLQLNKQFKEYKDKQLGRQAAAERTQERKRAMARTVELVVPISLAITVLVVFLIRKRHQKNLSEQEATAKHLQNANARLQAENEQLVQQQTRVQHAKPCKAPASSYEALMKEAICFDLRQRFGKTEIITTNKSSYYADLAISARDKQALTHAVERHCPNFGPLLKAQCPEFTRNDFELCRFLLIGLSEPQVAVLLQKDYSTIWKRAKEIKKVLQTAELEHGLRHVLFGTASME